MEIPKEVGPFELRRTIGHGTYGDVFEAYDAERSRAGPTARETALTNPNPARRGFGSWPSPLFSPHTVARCRRSWPGKEESAIRPEACFLHVEDRIVGSDAVQGATYGAGAGGW